VEFAVQNMKAGQDLIPATAAASRQRLRPILMTSIAFIFGVFPLAIATGAGASGRIAVGTGVIGGMLTATVLAIFFIPVFFVGIRALALRKRSPGTDNTRGAQDTGAGGLLPRRPLSGAPAPLSPERER
jgi:Cu/Ag efflux pump CusA